MTLKRMFSVIGIVDGYITTFVFEDNNIKTALKYIQDAPPITIPGVACCWVEYRPNTLKQVRTVEDLPPGEPGEDYMVETSLMEFLPHFVQRAREVPNGASP